MSKMNYLPLGILTGVTLLSSAVLSSAGGRAAVSCTTVNGVRTCTESKTASVTVSGACSFTGMTTGREVSLSPQNGGSAESGANALGTTVSCNTPNAFSVNIIGFSNDADGNTNLISSSGNIATGNNVPSPSGSTPSYWAIKFASSATGANAPTVVSTYQNYVAVPSSSTPVVNYPAVTDVSTRDDYTFYTQYKIYVSPTQAAGTYTGKVKYTLSQS